jgi:hypothetical protein
VVFDQKNNCFGQKPCKIFTKKNPKLGKISQKKKLKKTFLVKNHVKSLPKKKSELGTKTLPKKYFQFSWNKCKTVSHPR